MSKMQTLLVSGYWVMCKEDEDFNEEFGQNQFESADHHLNVLRAENPGYTFEMIAEIDA